MAIVTAAPALGRLVWSGSHSMWTGYGAVFGITLSAGVVAIAARGIRKIHRSGQTVGGVLLRRRELARARVDAADKLHAQAPLAAGIFTLCSFPAVFLAMVAAPSTGGLHPSAAADARLQLWCITAGVLGAVVGLDGWFGLGTVVRALATDGFTSAAVVFAVALATASPLMIFHHVDSRAAWLGVAATQFLWPFGGLFLCGAVSDRRKRRLHRLADMTLNSSVGSLMEPGIAGCYDLILQAPGKRKIPVIQAVVTVTGMGVEEAMDLVDNAPGHVLRQVTSERADRAKNLLESRGATVTVSSDLGWD